MTIKQQLEYLGLFHGSPLGSLSYTYTTTPTDDLDILRLLEGYLDCYRMPKFASEAKKKKIIITDPSRVYNLDDSATTGNEKHANVFSKLKDAGFEVYAWTGSLTPIANTNELSQIIHQVQPIHSRDLSKKIAEFGIASDAYYNYDVGHAQIISDLLVSNITEYSQIFMSVDKLLALSPNRLEALLSSIGNFPLIGLSFKNLRSDQIKEFLQQPIVIQYLKKHPVVSFSQEKGSWEFFNEIITLNPSLESIDIHTPMTGELSKAMPPLVKLKRLNCINNEVSWNDLEHMLASSHELEELRLRICKKLLNPSLNFKLPPSLKVLRILESKVKWLDLERLISNCHHLEELNLDTCGDIGTFSENFQLPKSLKKLNLSMTPTTWKQLEQLLGHDSILESLELNFCFEFGQVPSHFCLPKTLKKFSSFQSAITWNEIEKLLKNANGLETLDLKNCNNLNTLPAELRLPASLLSLSLASTKVTCKEIEKLLANCTHLESLNLSGCYLSPIPNNFTLPRNLKSLDLSRCLLTVKDIEKILATCPMLEELLGCNQLLQSLPKNYRLPPRLKISALADKQSAVISSDSKSSSFSFSGSRSSRRLDANTGSNKQNLSAQRVFVEKYSGHPPVNLYRKFIYADVDVNADGVNLVNAKVSITPYSIASKNDNCEEIYRAQYQKDDKTFLGTKVLPAGLNDWIPLTSLTPHDKLLHINTIPNIEFDLGYDAENAIYYIKPKYPLTQPITLSYIIEADLKAKIIPWNLSQFVGIGGEYFELINNLRLQENGELQNNDAKRKFCQLPLDIQQNALIDYFRSFSEKAITSPKNQVDLVNTIIQERAGVCRHRSTAYMALAKALKLPTHAIENDVHIFVEIKKDNAWHTVDLGGGYANITIHPIPALPVFNSTKMTTNFSPDKSVLPDNNALPANKVDLHKPILELAKDNRFRVWDTVSIKTDTMGDYVKQLLERTDKLPPGQKNVLSVFDRTQLESFSTALLQNKETNCYYLSDLNNVSLRRAVIKENGGHDYHDSELATFIKNAKPGDVLLVNWTEFDDSQVGYNTIISSSRSIKGIPIPDGVIVMGVLDRNQVMGEDFYSRIRLVSECPNN